MNEMNGSGGRSRPRLGVSEDPEQTGLKIAAKLTTVSHTDPNRPASPCRETQ